MTKITYVEHNGTKHEVEAEAGSTLMDVAVQNGVPGIDADCGGACACATCHVYIDTDWSDKLNEKGEMEEQMLELAENYQDTSRLACQVKVTPDMDGILVNMPESQY